MKSKRRMPAHIVLPNGMWRFVKRGAKSVRRSVSRSTRRKARKKEGIRMARYRRARRSSGGFGLKGIGMLPPVAKNVLAGWGAASAAEMLGFGGMLPAAVAGYVAAGTTGAAGGVGKTLLKGVDIKGFGGQIATNAIG